MNTPEQWNSRYENGELPWDTGRPDQNLQAIIGQEQITPCNVLELGCGTGTNAIWLAQQGFTVTAIDISERAISMARDKARAADVSVTFHVVDLLSEALPTGPFNLVFDRGCFHSFDTLEHRRELTRRIYHRLTPAGLWLSLIGSTDAPPREMGPPQLSALHIATAVETTFEIRLLEASHFDSDQADPAPCWICLMRGR